MNATATISLDRDEPDAFIGIPRLMRQAFSGGDLKPLGAKLIDRAERNPQDAHAMMDLATVLLLLGHRELALATQMDALQVRQIYRQPAAGAPKLRVLALKSAGDLMANTPLEFLLEDSDVSLDTLYVGAGIPVAAEIPEHDVLFIAVGESDENAPLLKVLEEVVRDWHCPVLNSPERIALLARDRACRLLQGVDGLVMPIFVRIDREALRQIGSQCEGADFPLIARPVGSHAGHGLKKIAAPDAIPDYLNGVPSSELYIAPFVDYRSADGLFRKYRIMLIEGRHFICHMAISSNWMIHYLNAGMLESPEKRAEEARFMDGFDAEFAPLHRAAFQAIYERFGLDYLGIDCGQTQDGKLLVFEVDSNMIVHAMDPVELFPYKQPRMGKLFAGFREMLSEAAAA